MASSSECYVKYVAVFVSDDNNNNNYYYIYLYMCVYIYIYTGAPRVTDPNDDQYLRTYALRHHYATATQLQAQLRDVRGTRVSRQTIQN